MPIDWERERVIRVKDVPRYVPSRAEGKRVSPATVWRWIGRTTDPLETFSTPGGRFTSIEAVGRFIDRVTASKSPRPSVRPRVNTARPPRSRRQTPCGPGNNCDR